MKETSKNRIQRLGARKGKLLEQIKALRESPNVRNAEFKANRLNEQVSAITEKIRELEKRRIDA